MDLDPHIKSLKLRGKSKSTGLTMSDTDSVSSSSSVASVSKNTIALISQTLNMAEHMQENAASLYSTYASLQGEPYNDPSFGFPDIQIANLPTAAIEPAVYMKQTDEARLKNNYFLYSVLTKFLHLVMEDQRELNPTEDALTAKFEEALGNMDALVSNIAAILSQMGVGLKAIFPDPLVQSYEGSAIFQKKLRGYIVCREYKEWVRRTTQDFESLNRKYGGQ